MGERVTMEWQEVHIDAHLPSGGRKGLGVEITIAGEMVRRYAVTQEAAKYRRTDCVKHIFYWLIDEGIFEEIDLSPVINPPGQTVDIPF